MNKPKEIEDKITSPLFPVVGIGVTAAEIEILKKIIFEIPAVSGMSYLIIENLYFPQSEKLAEQLTAFSKIPVVEIINEIELHPDHIYIVPENNFLVLENGILKLKPRTRSSRVNNCLDVFFESLATVYSTYALGVILSSNPLDGAAGLKKLKEFGGATISVLSNKNQNNYTAEFIDYYAEPERIVSKLLDIQNSYLITHAYFEGEIDVSEQELFNEIVSIVSVKTGTDFHRYKYQTLRRRIAKRMVNTKQDTIEKYLKLLKDNTKEQDLLFHDFLIPVTYFFRDQSYFDNLAMTAFPSLIENVSNKNIRIWSAGCSTGEEAYSLAICIDEYLNKTNNNDIKIQIFASDLSEKNIAKARTGVYTLQDLKNISEERIEQYFTKKDSGYHVNKNIRDKCVFAIHDLTKDAPFAKIDFVSCRNVLIYFDPNLQNQIFESFHYALRNKGILFLGKAESANNVQNLFTLLEKQEKIYIRKDAAIKHKIFHPDFNIAASKIKNIPSITNNEIDYRKIATDILLEQYSPAAVIINEDLEIVHFHGDTSPFLQPPPGKPSFNILNMVNDEIGFELRNAVLKARNEKKNFSGESIAVKKLSFITSFEVIFLPSNIELLLIIFCKKNILPPEQNNSGENRTEELERELLQLRGDFKRVTEEQQIYFEELQTTNEELLSSTDELQLINEELETSAEELQSNNKELSCINDELQDGRDELASMRNFYESIVNTIREPLIIIDKNYIVKNANPSFYKYFKTQQEKTEGFSIFEIADAQWNIPQFKETVLKKLAQNNIVENFKIEFRTPTGEQHILILNASPILNSIPEGMILIALEDVTELEHSDESLKSKNMELLGYSRQLESFTDAASNNLLEPIRKIYMFGKKILDNEANLTESGRHNAKRLLSAAVNMNQLIEDLIDYSKINFSKKEFKKTDLNIVLKKTLSDLKTAISAYKAVIINDPLPTLRVIAPQMQLLFTHLISNAIKYTKQGTTPEIKISIDYPSTEAMADLGADPEINYIKIYVSDNGIGFNKDFEKLIFTPFYKLDSNDLQYGSGLGLTLVEKITANHKGFIKVSSQPSIGTTVNIFLPLQAI
ncbi:CheR family methyltransferase [Flavobacterium sp. ACN6]|uniref:CheR family methyltransferase n=1 Tax=Flavobacterium sp. ACN6 TaxID=1920426 RepID=UPI000BB2ED9F|nr:CheR family methyltransferase [Flavobacterium sp. ACN6]PBJ10174.1 Chemotaxis protein methyltransferase Cher2 [Flavobacterium sp. ACN6]